MRTLKALLANLRYDPAAGLWAKPIEGRYTAESPAFYGAPISVQSLKGPYEGFELVGSGDVLGSALASWWAWSAEEFNLEEGWFEEVLATLNTQQGAD
jgi:hypothetical protein